MQYKSPLTHPCPDVEIKQGSPAIKKPAREDILQFPEKAFQIVEDIFTLQEQKQDFFSLEWMKDRHFLLCGATGYGLGANLACAVLAHLGEKGSLTILARDLKSSINYHTGLCLEKKALEKGVSFQRLNSGISLEPSSVQPVIEALKGRKAKDIIVINTVAYAFSGLFPGFPPIFVKDLDENDDLIQWQLAELNEKQVQINQEVMGDASIRFPGSLEEAGITLSASVFCDWRGSLDKVSRMPEAREYGRQGAYSTSLYIPKQRIQNYVKESVFCCHRYLADVFFPIMDTPALRFLPGGRLIFLLMNGIMKRNGFQEKKVSYLALELLHTLGRDISRQSFNPFPRFHCQESQFDILFFHVLEKLNNKKDDLFFYKNWI